MSKSSAVVVSCVLAALLLAGCHGDEPTTSNTGDDNLDLEPATEVTSITVIQAPDSAAPGDDIMICWDLDGQGTVPHTAVHFDNESHPDTLDFGDYDLAIGWPDNETRQRDGGYDVPFTYCTSFAMIDETVYFRAHVIVDAAPGMLTEEHSITADQ